MEGLRKDPWGGMDESDWFAIKTIFVFIAVFSVAFFFSGYFSNFLRVLEIIIILGLIFSFLATLILYKPGINLRRKDRFGDVVFFTGEIITALILGTLVSAGFAGELSNPFILNWGETINSLLRFAFYFFVFLNGFLALNLIFLFIISLTRDELSSRKKPLTPAV